jgi:hypothetical protein
MKRIALASLPQKFQTVALGLLAGSRFAKPDKWRHAILIVTPEDRRVAHRLEFAAELRGGGLEVEAKEIADEVLRSGELLAYLLRDDEGGADCAVGVLTIGGRR